MQTQPAGCGYSRQAGRAAGACTHPGRARDAQRMPMAVNDAVVLGGPLFVNTQITEVAVATARAVML